MSEPGSKRGGNTLGWVVLLSGAFLSLTGIGFCVMYFVEAIIKRTGEADQSLLFWYLPILFIGIFALMAGLGLLAWGRRRPRN